MGGVGQNLVMFQLIWHQDPIETMRKPRATVVDNAETIPPTYDSASNAVRYGDYSASTSSLGGYNDYPPSRSTAQVYDQYDNSYPTTSTPCPTPAWSSQPGYIPYTKTYTTTTVQTITECRRNDKACPLNTATRTAYITETKTATVTQTCNAGCTTRVTGVPQGYTTTVKYCDACATPSTVTVTYCTACANQPSATPIKGTPLSVPSKPSTIPSKPSSVAKPSSASSIQGYDSPPSSKPVEGTPSVPSKPSNPPVYDTPVVKSTPTTNAASTPSKPTTLQSNVASMGVYFSTGTNCVATPTRSQSAQYTGSASRAGSPISFAMLAVFSLVGIFVL